MTDLDVSLEEVKALTLMDMAIEKAMFPMIEGSEVQNLASSRARVRALKTKLAKYIQEREEETAKEMVQKAGTAKAPKNPIKKPANGN